MARVVPLALVGVAAWFVVVQPLPDLIEHDALFAIAGIVATVLSLGFTVTLLVAQHTADRHARVIYREFRRERAWLSVLGSLAVGVLLIVGFSLALPTMSTAWAALALTAALGAYAASLLPRMLNSLDATQLAERLADTYRNVYWGPIPEDVQDAIRAAKRRIQGPNDAYERPADSRGDPGRCRGCAVDPRRLDVRAPTPSGARRAWRCLL